MTRRVRVTRDGGAARAERAREWLLAASVGAAVGGFVGWALARRPGQVAGDVRGDTIAWRDRIGERLGDGFGAAVEGLREFGGRFVHRDPPDGVELEARLALVDGAHGIRIHDLGDGIVELTGTASDPTARAAAAAVARVPGVRAVVNRVWTPSSEAASRVDAPPGVG